MNRGPAISRFIGVWGLEAIRDRLPDGRVKDHPDFGPNPSGLIVYTESGHVSVQFMRSGRRTWRDEDEPTVAERAEAARGYSGYAGRYEVDEAAGTVLHHVETALIPNRVGRTLTRFYAVFGGFADTLCSPLRAGRRRGQALVDVEEGGLIARNVVIPSGARNLPSSPNRAEQILRRSSE